jgi:uncharacterized cupin superfamily protein
MVSGPPDDCCLAPPAAGRPGRDEYVAPLCTFGAGRAAGRVYHHEAGQEDFLILRGRCILVIDGEERSLGAWDFVHCPPQTAHTIVAAGDEPALIFAVGARTERGSARYPFEPAAVRHGAGVPDEQTSGHDHYATFGTPQPGPPPPALGGSAAAW